MTSVKIEQTYSQISQLLPNNFVRIKEYLNLNLISSFEILLGVQVKYVVFVLLRQKYKL